MTRQFTLESKVLVAAVFLLGTWFTFDVIRSVVRQGTRGRYQSEYYTRTDAPLGYYFYMTFKSVLVVIIWGTLYFSFF